MNIEERSDVVYQILELAKSNSLSVEHKKKIYDIVMSLNNRTENQKQRFLLFYNLNVNQEKTYRQCDLARLYNVLANAIRCSVGRIRNALVNLRDERMVELKDILEDNKNKMKKLPKNY